MNEIWGWFAPGTTELIRLAPLLTPLVGGVAAWVAIRTLKQRTRIDSSDEWWKRAEFALDKSASENPDAQLMGAALLKSLRVRVEPPANLGFWAKRKWEREFRKSNVWNVQQKDMILLAEIVKASTFPNGMPSETMGETKPDGPSGEE